MPDCGWCGKECSERYWLWEWYACQECFQEITMPNCILCGDSGVVDSVICGCKKED